MQQEKGPLLSEQEKQKIATWGRNSRAYQKQLANYEQQLEIKFKKEFTQVERQCPECNKKFKGNQYGAHFKNQVACLLAKKANKNQEEEGIGRMDQEDRRMIYKNQV